MSEVVFINEQPSDDLRELQIYPFHQVARMIDKYVCAQCWGMLIAQPTKNRQEYEISCPDCGESCGLVTRNFAAARQVFSYWDYLEARRNLAEVLGLKVKPVDEKQILKDLGY